MDPHPQLKLGVGLICFVDLNRVTHRRRLRLERIAGQKILKLSSAVLERRGGDKLLDSQNKNENIQFTYLVRRIYSEAGTRWAFAAITAAT